MKKITSIIALLCAININANAEHINGSAQIGYKSDYYFRGENVSGKALGLEVGASGRVGKVDLFVNHHTNQPETGADFSLTAAGAGISLIDDLLSLYGGVLNQKTDGGGSDLDVFLSGNISTVVDVQLSVYRDTSDDLYTFEGSLSKSFDLDVVTLNTSVDGGTTENVGNDTSYYGATLSLSKDIENVTLEAGGSFINGSDIDNDEICFASVSFKF